MEIEGLVARPGTAPSPAFDPTQEGFQRRWYLTQDLKVPKAVGNAELRKGTKSGF